MAIQKHARVPGSQEPFHKCCRRLDFGPIPLDFQPQIPRDGFHPEGFIHRRQILPPRTGHVLSLTGVVKMDGMFRHQLRGCPGVVFGSGQFRSQRPVHLPQRLRHHADTAGHWHEI